MGRVGERDVKMLIDTGAAVTLVHRKVLIGKGMSLKLKPVLTPVITASGEQLTIDGQGTAVFTLGRSVVEQDVLVMGEIAEDCLLGADFLLKHKGVIELDKAVLYLGENKGHLPRSSRVNHRGKVTIPARQELIAWGNVKTSRVPKGVVGVVEPTSIIYWSS